MSESLSLPCPRCGAALPADPSQQTVTCSYCHTLVPIPEELRRRAFHHQARVAAARRKADAAEDAAAQLRSWSGSQQYVFIMMGVLFVVMVGLGAVANLLGPYLPKEAMGILMPLIVYGTMGGCAVAFYIHRRRKKNAASAPLAVATSICARCGASLTFVAGGASAVCQSCNATGIAGQTIVRDLEGAAERRAEELELDRVRAERQMYRGMAASQRFGQYYLIFAMGWPVAAVGVIGFIAGVSELISGLTSGKARAINHGIEAFATGCALALGAAVIAGLVYLFVLRPARAPGAVLKAIGVRLGGSATHGGTATAIDWLDAYWPGTTGHELLLIQGELMRYTLTTWVDRTPVLVVVLAGGSNVRSARIHVLVASPRPRAERAVLSTQAARELQNLGFSVRASNVGVTLVRHTLDDSVMNEQTLGWALGAGVTVARA